MGPGNYVAKCFYKMIDVDPEEGNEDAEPTQTAVPLDGAPDDDAAFYYICNGFYPAMAGKFTADGAALHWYVVEFRGSKLTWAEFRGGVVGKTNPAEAQAGSLRGKLHAGWEQLGLAAQPSTGENGVHASAGPLEALRERTVWLGNRGAEDDVEADPYGAKLMEIMWGDAGAARLPLLLENEVVSFGAAKGPIFDLTEDKDSLEVLCMCNNIAHASDAEIAKYYPAAE